MNFKLLLLLCCFSTAAFSQSITNGNFTNSGTGWGCNPETNPERVYGGSGTNRVAEIDASAGRCQTISGFTVGYTYTLNFLCSRRTTCGPTVQTMSVTISNGALSTTVSRNGTGFAFTSESFLFTATSTTQTLTFAGTSSGTCGLIIDDVEISFTAVPVKLISFDGKRTNDQTVFSWSTATELNNDFFLLEKSIDGETWETLAQIKGSGTTHSTTDYTHTTDGVSRENYFRLSQTDFDGESELLKTIKIETAEIDLDLFPNPAQNHLKLRVTESFVDSEAKIVNQWGQEEFSIALNKFQGLQELDISHLQSGVYYLLVGESTKLFVKQ